MYWGTTPSAARTAALQGGSNPLGSGGGSGIEWGSGVNGGSGANIIGYWFSGSPFSSSGGGAGGGAGGSGNNTTTLIGGPGLPISAYTGNPLDFAGVGGGGDSSLQLNGGFGQRTLIFGGRVHPQAFNSPTEYGRGGTCGIIGITTDPQSPKRPAGTGAVLIRYV